MPEGIKHGRALEWGRRTCGYGLERSECDRQATHHVMWDDSSTSAACDEHMDYLARRATEQFKTHPFGSVCDHPGTWWFTPNDPEQVGFCYFGDVPSLRTPEAVEWWLDAEMWSS